MDEFSKITGYNAFGVVTGKPLILGGSEGREKATAMGCCIVIREAAAKLGIDIKGARIAIQGFGNAGSNLAAILHDMGAKIVAISDLRGGLYNPNGFNPYEVEKRDEAVQFKDESCAAKYPGTQFITSQELMTLDCDVLVPAAIENQITGKNAGSIKARIVAEAANGPTTPEGNDILINNGVFILPDILASAGGVTVSYFEWVQNLQSLAWEEDEVNNRLEKVMTQAFAAVWEKGQEKGTTLRMGAYMLAIDKLVKAHKIRGIFP